MQEPFITLCLRGKHYTFCVPFHYVVFFPVKQKRVCRIEELAWQSRALYSYERESICRRETKFIGFVQLFFFEYMVVSWLLPPVGALMSLCLMENECVRDFY